MSRRADNPVIHSKSVPIHLVGDQPFKLALGEEARTQCGLVVSPISYDFPFYTLSNLTGGDMRGTTRIAQATCLKCRARRATATAQYHK